MDKRYQVFVSSTFADLKQERQKVIQTLMEMDCIPAGMELFPTADEEQWTFIKRVINDCDYYVLIIGGRYGTVTPEGISYTEKEYDYAISKGLRVLTFVHERPEEIPLGKSDIDPTLREKLEAFRSKVSESRLVKLWSNAAELPGLVALSLSKTIKSYPAVGWVRASKIASDELLVDLNELRKENERLKTTVDQLETQITQEDTDLASIDEIYEIKLELTSYHHETKYVNTYKVTASWAEIFGSMAPDLLEHPIDFMVNSRLADSLYRKVQSRTEGTVKILHDYFQTIKVQLIALGLVTVMYNRTTTGSMALFWSLTKKGQWLMAQLRTVKSTKNQPPGLGDPPLSRDS